MKKRFNYDISYYKIWDAKQKVIANIHESWEESYQKLQKLLLAYKDSDPSTQVSFKSINGDIPGTIIFKYVLWAFALSIAEFAHCRPVISIDENHLYGKYKKKLLIAMATDTNNEIFPLAFAVMDDGTHLYGKYKGKLLITMATDANNEIFRLPLWLWMMELIFPLAFAQIPINKIDNQNTFSKKKFPKWFENFRFK